MLLWILGFVIGMTVTAGALRVAERLAGVALLAGDHRVQAQQRKSRQTVVETHTCRPSAFRMAFLTGLVLLSAMHVVLRVARLACSVELRLPYNARMAALTRDICVLSAQREVGLPVIELFVRPAHGSVTRRTVGAETAFVLVVGGVAAHAGLLQLGLQAARVTAAALLGAMGAAQRELRVLVVIEADPIPCVAGVAAGAVRAEAATVDVVHGVAGCAL